jgi:mannose-6-phosphate isomerase-like protein (cupin superfamily)
MHYVGRGSERALIDHPLYRNQSSGYTCASLVNHETGSVHTGLSLNELAIDGTIAYHMHSFEEAFYLLDGRAIVDIDGQAFSLGAGDFGVAKVGSLHAWRNAGITTLRWLQMAAPQPKPIGRERDTFFGRQAVIPATATLDASTPNGALLGHFDASQIPPPGSGRIGAGTLEGIFLRWLVDEKLGARHHKMLFIEYQPGVGIGLHDHTFEEAYFFVSGEVEATLDGVQYTVKAGDVVWTSVGCVHAFNNTSETPVRWLETFSPQPPTENVFRFMAEWEEKAQKLKTI